ncbi:hypothetical protein ACUTJJ_05455 [Agrobacterium sp. DKPNP3]|uniref:hypothetical protein n=1 Tax=Agrobacterium sp. DKPNP3 TaxID=3457323 RepID=UPI0040445E1E
MLRKTAYADEIATARDDIGQTIERIHVKEHGKDEIRFSWWVDGKMMVRPLDLPEEELLPLMREAIRKGVFSADFLRNLHQVLYEERHQIIPCDAL